MNSYVGVVPQPSPFDIWTLPRHLHPACAERRRVVAWAMPADGREMVPIVCFDEPSEPPHVLAASQPWARTLDGLLEELRSKADPLPTAPVGEVWFGRAGWTDWTEDGALTVEVAGMSRVWSVTADRLNMTDEADRLIGDLRVDLADTDPEFMDGGMVLFVNGDEGAVVGWTDVEIVHEGGNGTAHNGVVVRLAPIEGEAS